MIRSTAAHILLIESDTADASARRDLLRAHGYSVRIARSVREAVDIAADDGPVDLVLLDTELGAGVTEAEAARRVLDKRVVPLVFLGNNGDEKLIARVRSVPHYGYVLKQAGEYVLVDAIETALELFTRTGGGDADNRLRALQLESEERRRYLEAVLASVPDAVVTSDPQHRIVEWNPGAEILFGYTADEARGRDVDDLVAGPETDVHREAREITRAVSQEGRVPRMEAVRYRKDGSPVHVLLSGAPIFLEGKLAGVVATYRDVTERVRTEHRLAEERERVEGLLEERDLLYRESRHRIKNDLALVRSLLSLQANENEDEACAESLRQASTRVSIISRLHELLFNSAEVETVPVRQFVHDIVEELQGGWSPDGVQLDVQTEDFSAPAKVSVSLGIILNELVTNTMKHGFGDDGPPGEAEEKHSGAASIQITTRIARAEGERVLLSFHDTGVGFPQDVLDGQRRGLGLTIIEALVGQHEGEFRLWNTEDGAYAEVSLSLKRS